VSCLSLSSPFSPRLWLLLFCGSLLTFFMGHSNHELSQISHISHRTSSTSLNRRDLHFPSFARHFSPFFFFFLSPLFPISNLPFSMTSPLDSILRRLESKSTEERVLALSLLPKALSPPQTLSPPVSLDSTPDALDLQPQQPHTVSESDLCKVWDVIQRNNASFVKKLLRSSKETFQGAAVQVLSVLSSVEPIAQSKGMISLFPLLCAILTAEAKNLVGECRLDVVEVDEGFVESLVGTITAIVRSANRSIPLDCLREVFMVTLHATVLTDIHCSLLQYTPLHALGERDGGMREMFKKSLIAHIRIRSVQLLYYAVKSDVHRSSMREMASDGTIHFIPFNRFRPSTYSFVCMCG
jgi:hypothetical protein